MALWDILNGGGMGMLYGGGMGILPGMVYGALNPTPPSSGGAGVGPMFGNAQSAMSQIGNQRYGAMFNDAFAQLGGPFQAAGFGGQFGRRGLAELMSSGQGSLPFFGGGYSPYGMGMGMMGGYSPYGMMGGYSPFGMGSPFPWWLAQGQGQGQPQQQAPGLTPQDLGFAPTEGISATDQPEARAPFQAMTPTPAAGMGQFSIAGAGQIQGGEGIRAGQAAPPPAPGAPVPAVTTPAVPTASPVAMAPAQATSPAQAQAAAATVPTTQPAAPQMAPMGPLNLDLSALGLGTQTVTLPPEVQAQIAAASVAPSTPAPTAQRAAAPQLTPDQESTLRKMGILDGFGTGKFGTFGGY